MRKCCAHGTRIPRRAGGGVRGGLRREGCAAAQNGSSTGTKPTATAMASRLIGAPTFTKSMNR